MHLVFLVAHDLLGGVQRGGGERFERFKRARTGKSSDRGTIVSPSPQRSCAVISSESDHRPGSVLANLVKLTDQSEGTRDVHKRSQLGLLFCCSQFKIVLRGYHVDDPHVKMGIKIETAS